MPLSKVWEAAVTVIRAENEAMLPHFTKNCGFATGLGMCAWDLLFAIVRRRVFHVKAVCACLIHAGFVRWEHANQRMCGM